MQHRSKEEFTGSFLMKRNRFKLWPKFEALFEFFLYYCSMLFFFNILLNLILDFNY